jgi:hypothetical protein
VCAGGDWRAPKSKPDRKPEKYMEDAHKGALEIEKICSKDVLFP